MQDARKDPGKTARYLSILEVVRARIRDGTYAVNGQLPSEAEFCTEFGASRFTIREALRRLQAEGLVARRQGAGTTVTRQRRDDTFLQSYGSMDQLLKFAADTDYRKLSVTQEVLTPELAARLGAEDGAHWTCQRGLRLERGAVTPLALIESYLPPAVAHLVPELAERSPPFYAFLEDRMGERATDMVQEVQAVAMPARVAEALAMEEGAVCLRILRRYETESGTLIASFNWHPGENRFIYRSRLEQVTGAE